MNFSDLWQNLGEFFLEWEMFQIKVTKKIKIHILFSVTFSRKSCRLWHNVEKCGEARQVADNNMADARCMLDSRGYTRASTRPQRCIHTHTQTYNTYFFSTATMVTWTRLSVTLLFFFTANCATITSSRKVNTTVPMLPFQRVSFYNMQHSTQSTDTLLLISWSQVDCKHGIPRDKPLTENIKDLDQNFDRSSICR